jgi:hypothetical protein
MFEMGEEGALSMILTVGTQRFLDSKITYHTNGQYHGSRAWSKFERNSQTGRVRDKSQKDVGQSQRKAPNFRTPMTRRVR